MSATPARKTIYVSSRKSQLAMVQTNEVIATLQVTTAYALPLCVCVALHGSHVLLFALHAHVFDCFWLWTCG